MYAYKFNITSHLYASTALQVSYFQRKLAWENLTFEDMIDPQNGFVLPTSEKQPDNLTIGAPDFSAGIFLGYDDFTILPDHYKKYDGTQYDAIRAVLTKENFNNNLLLKDLTKSWIYGK